MPNVTQVDIANMALALLTEAPIRSLSDNNKAARLVSQHFDLTVEAELEANVWAFAITSIEEVDGTDTGVEVSGALNWEYELPGDFLRLLPLGYDSRHNAIPVSWELRDGKLYSDQESPRSLRYIAMLTDPNDWTATFTEVVVAALALKLAYPITQKQSFVQAAQNAYERALERALVVNAVQRSGTLDTNSWAIARGDYRWRP